MMYWDWSVNRQPVINKGFQDIIIDGSLKLEKTFTNEVDIKKALEVKGMLNPDRIESVSEGPQLIKTDKPTHGMWLAICYAHSYHVPVEFCPEDFWITII